MRSTNRVISRMKNLDIMPVRVALWRAEREKAVLIMG